jgi:hypothetical protein
MTSDYDLATLGAGSKVYDVYATIDGNQDLHHPVAATQYAKERRTSAKKIGDAGADLSADRIGLW